MADDQGTLAAPDAAAADAPTSPSHDAPRDGDDGVEIAAAAEEEATRSDAVAVRSEPTAASSSGQPIDPGKSILEDITALKAQKKKLRDQKAALARDLRNAERRRSRLKKRAKALSDADLLAVISLRNHEKALGAAAHATDDSDSDSEGGDAPTQTQEPTASGIGQGVPKEEGACDLTN